MCRHKPSCSPPTNQMPLPQNPSRKPTLARPRRKRPPPPSRLRRPSPRARRPLPPLLKRRRARWPTFPPSPAPRSVPPTPASRVRRSARRRPMIRVPPRSVTELPLSSRLALSRRAIPTGCGPEAGWSGRGSGVDGSDWRGVSLGFVEALIYSYPATVNLISSS